MVIGDERRVERVLLNLIGNAIKYTEKGSIRIYVEKVDVAEEGKIVLRIYIKDTGIGIPQEKQAEVFERFTHVIPSYSSAYRGAGLGLFIAKQLMNELHGSLELKSEPEKGTIFCCTIPFKKPPNSDDST
jgi:signal transduction histidine kinase